MSKNQFLWLFLMIVILITTVLLKQSQSIKSLNGMNTSQLSHVLLQNKLTVVIINSPFKLVYSTYSAGFNDDLARNFAKYLGVELDIIHTESLQDVIIKPDIIIGLPQDPIENWLIGPPIYTQHLQLVALHNTNIQLETSRQLYQSELAISETLQQSDVFDSVLKQNDESGYLLTSLSKEDDLYTFSDIQAYESGNPFYPLIGLISGKEDFAIVDSVSAAIFRRIHPELKIITNIAENEAFAWHFAAPGGEDSLLKAFESFHQEPQTLDILDKLAEKYFTPIAPFDKVDTYRFIRSVKHKLPEFKPFFVEHAKEFDWRLIAAIAYQESHWDPLAKSPTGVRGMMMLTRDTASYLGIDDRLDTEKSILGGVQYLRFLLERIPETVEADERIWFALAAYNMGIGHLWDARDLTLLRGGNPDSWHDVKKNLPLLRDEAIYPTLKYGFARGDEALVYVENIRRYYTSLLGLEAMSDMNIQIENISSLEPNVKTQTNG
ncbi:membrane-bound lytic murein transglycosylase MltF [Thorsellia anophelis]|uniref:peptidoglycan lytic exotransglycosylase n=1 Tax=Thorsellia anophelis DSM 18579 TaxID=1123402 RepID=A0A1H9YCT1_9GAMM|nr:membrane-bound lytic murein transglycosylase MltF [Thorsellia anophelis]SES66684.1 membrane-bound lytic murein transglycosylase F [Thorsellia anophelis DSM 18579]